MNLKYLFFIIFFCILQTVNLYSYSETDEAYLKVNRLDSVSILSSDWFFKAEDEINFKNREINTSDWELVTPAGIWQNVKPELSDYTGNVWYRLNLNIENIDNNEKIGLSFPYSYGSVQIYLNGLLVHETRGFSNDGTTEKIGSKPEYIEIPVNLLNKGQNIFALRVSSTDGWGGFPGFIKLGPLKKIKSEWTRFIIIQTSISFICLFLSLYFLIYYFARKSEKYYLWFALLNLCIGVMNLGFHGISLYILDRYWAYSIISFLGAINTYYMILYFIHSFLGRKMRILGKILTGYYILTSLAVLTEYVLTGHVILFIKYQYNIFNLSYILLLVYLIVLNIKAIKAKTAYAKLFLIGVSILTISFLLNMMIFTGLFYNITGFNIMPLIGESFFAMIVVFSTILALRFSKTHIDLEVSNAQNIELNLHLEQKVKDRTAELKEKNDEIMESIDYAALIQNTMIPEEELLNSVFSDHYTIWNPRDVVGGDFYWLHKDEKSGDFIIALGDCTGHGVPGALLTMSAASALSRIVEHINRKNPALILKEYNAIMKNLLSQEQIDSKTNDGLDVGICCFNNKEKKLTFAGAKIKIHIYDKGELTEIAGDKKGIGYRRTKADFNFTNYEIPLTGETSIYLSSDGFTDQGGGENNFSFGWTRYRDLLSKIGSDSMKEQRKSMLAALKEFQGESVTRDDITLLGFKISIN